MIWNEVEAKTNTRISNRGFNGVDVYERSGRVVEKIGTFFSETRLEYRSGYRVESDASKTSRHFAYSEQVEAVEWLLDEAGLLRSVK